MNARAEIPPETAALVHTLADAMDIKVVDIYSALIVHGLKTRPVFRLMAEVRRAVAEYKCEETE